MGKVKRNASKARTEAKPVELKPCPFCGENKGIITNLPNRPYGQIFCKACACLGPEGLNRDFAIKLWNTRASDN